MSKGEKSFLIVSLVIGTTLVVLWLRSPPEYRAVVTQTIVQEWKRPPLTPEELARNVARTFTDLRDAFK